MTSLIMTADTIGLHKVSDWLSNIAKSAKRRSQVKNTIKELNQLSDYELQDIGIHRSQIYSIAMEVHTND